MCGCDQVFGLVREGDPDAGAGPDAAQGCWAAGQSGDEDQDQLLDGCDQCPQDVDTAVTDGDRDGVGDQCDPDLAASNAIIAFDGFAMDGAWSRASGTWVRRDGNRGEYAQLIGVGAAYTELTVTPVRHPTIDVRFTLDVCQSNCGAGAQITYPAARVTCLFEYLNGDDAVVLYINDLAAGKSPLNATGTIRIQLQALPNGVFQCQGFSGISSGAITGIVTVPDATTTVGLVTKSDPARFQSILVISSP